MISEPLWKIAYAMGVEANASDYITHYALMWTYFQMNFIQ